MPAFNTRPPLFRTAAAVLALSFVSAALAHPPGRLTGGGSILCLQNGGRVTHGFELHCGTGSNPEGSNPPEPNNLEINWAGGNNFHLTDLAVADCSGPEASTPPAPFSIMDGVGTGTLNQLPASIVFRLTDVAEPGAGADFGSFVIVQGGNIVLNCQGVLEQGGNHQAHRATGSKQ